MTTAGPNGPGTAASTNRGNPDWTNPNDALTEDDTPSFSAVITQATDYLDLTTFSFAVSGTILGILVEVKKFKATGAQTIVDETIQLLKAGAAVGSNKADVSTQWPTTNTYLSYGGSSDLWGTTWTASEINASGFGIRIAASASVSGNPEVDYARITITYTASVTVTPSAATITLATFTPTVVSNLTVTPSAKAVTLATFTPTVSTPIVTTPVFATVPVQGFAPVVTTSASGVVTPSPATITVQRFTPTVSTPNLMTPLTLALTLALFTPHVHITSFNLAPLIGASVPRMYGPPPLDMGFYSEYAPRLYSPGSGRIRRYG